MFTQMHYVWRSFHLCKGSYSRVVHCRVIRKCENFYVKSFRLVRPYTSKSRKGLLIKYLMSAAFCKSVEHLDFNEIILQKPNSPRYSNGQGIIIKFWFYIWDTCQTFIRVVQLWIIFIPLLLFYPVTILSSNWKKAWYKLLLFDLELSGPVFIKLGQWASTRFDLFPEEMCLYLSKLQRKTKPHSWSYTAKVLEEAYGHNWRNVFVKFEMDQLIGSGCCAQVYKAWIKPEFLNKLRAEETLNAIHSSVSNKLDREEDLIPVAVKVRHPFMEVLLKRDLAIMKSFAKFLTWMIPSLHWLSLSDCVEDFSKMMEAQVDLCVEGKNLEIFMSNFSNIPAVTFPKPILHLTKPYILVETYEDGISVQHYVVSREQQEQALNRRLAELGVNTILKMVFEDNFTHGDLHPGNILVQLNEQPPEKKSSSLSLFKANGRASPSTATLVILDCGIVASLDDRGKKCLKDVFYAVVNNDGERVAELFLEHSTHQCKDTHSFKTSMREIVNTALSNRVTLEEVEISSLLKLLFTTLIEHKVKLDGSFSSIMLAMMVLEGLGRSLDPMIDLVDKARPFLLNVM